MKGFDPNDLTINDCLDLLNTPSEVECQLAILNCLHVNKPDGTDNKRPEDFLRYAS